MAALDTSVLVRYLVQDDTAQFSKAQRLIQQSLANGESLFIPVTVLIEIEWVLRSRCALRKPQILSTLVTHLSAAELSIDREPAIEAALIAYQSSNADFSDCIHAALAHEAGESPL
jgi:predicted nucleic-acid-binding protein